MGTLVFDIETVAQPWESFDAITQEQIRKKITKADISETDPEFHEHLDSFALSPLTGSIIAIGLYDIERKTGARGLRSILEEILLDTMFDLPGMENVDEIVVNEEAVTTKAGPLVIYGDAQREPASAG